MIYQKQFDVIVCGGGHAGCEAALAAARMGAETLLLSGNLDTIAQMSCNPAIGGQAKGQMVREIDALGGEMAINTDLSGIQFRLLNESKGPAVQAPRAQCDKKVYQFRMKQTLEHQKHLQIFQAEVTKLLVQNDKVIGVSTGHEVDFLAETVILTTGTFLRGLMHIGKNQIEGGRLGDFSARHLSKSLLELGIELGRLKTGTPPRVLGSSLDFSQMQEQRGDAVIPHFAFMDTRDPEDLFHVEQNDEVRPGWPAGSVDRSCWMVYTSSRTLELVRENLGRSAMYSGNIEGTGARYCPSIEDKVVRFADKERHLLFLEPEGLSTDEYYINGLSTSLPFDVQVELVHSIPGMERAVLMRPAYAVEYDYAPPTQILPSLESKKVENLFFAGQINGTSGYEEAAAQGLVAGVNAVNKLRGRVPMIIGRQEAYIGVLIDDLVTKGTSEPYRMFTSRAEHRLLFNHGSAELRLLEHAAAQGLVSAGRLERMRDKKARIEHWTQELESQKAPVGKGTLADGIRRAITGDEPMPALPDSLESETKALKNEVFYRIGYKGYLLRELRQIEKLSHVEKIKIPPDFDYMNIRGLRKESAQKLAAVKPYSLGQASRISGVNPADISILMVALAAQRGKTLEETI